MSDAASEFRPPWAVTMWVSDQHIFAEVPMSGGQAPPYIAKFPLTSTGLGVALNCLKQIHDGLGHLRYEPPQVKVARKTKRTAKPKVELSPEQNDRIKSILKKKGLINE